MGFLYISLGCQTTDRLGIMTDVSRFSPVLKIPGSFAQVLFEIAHAGDRNSHAEPKMTPE